MGSGDEILEIVIRSNYATDARASIASEHIGLRSERIQAIWKAAGLPTRGVGRPGVNDYTEDPFTSSKVDQLVEKVKQAQKNPVEKAEQTPPIDKTKRTRFPERDRLFKEGRKAPYVAKAVGKNENTIYVYAKRTGQTEMWREAIQEREEAMATIALYIPTMISAPCTEPKSPLLTELQLKIVRYGYDAGWSQLDTAFIADCSQARVSSLWRDQGKDSRGRTMFELPHTCRYMTLKSSIRIYEALDFGFSPIEIQELYDSDPYIRPEVIQEAVKGRKKNEKAIISHLRKALGIKTITKPYLNGELNGTHK